MSVAWSSSIIRVAGDAFQCRPWSGFSRSCVGGIGLDEQPGLAGVGTPSGFRTTISGRRVSPCSAIVALSVCGIVLPLGEHLIGQAERLLEDEVDPLPMDRRARAGRPAGCRPTPRRPA